MNTNRMTGIVNRIASKRIALEQSPYQWEEIGRMAGKDFDSEVFVYDYLITGEVHRSDFKSHRKLIEEIIHNNKEKIQKLEIIEEDENDLYWRIFERMLRGYWLPGTSQIFFYGDPRDEQVSKVLKGMNIEPEKIYSI